MYKIEKGVPVPEPSRRPAVRHLYPWDEMGDGDSFVVEVSLPFELRTARKRAVNAGNHWCKTHAPHLMIRARAESETSVRIWMVRREG